MTDHPRYSLRRSDQRCCCFVSSARSAPRIVEACVKRSYASHAGPTTFASARDRSGITIAGQVARRRTGGSAVRAEASAIDAVHVGVNETARLPTHSELIPLPSATHPWLCGSESGCGRWLARCMEAGSRTPPGGPGCVCARTQYWPMHWLTACLSASLLLPACLAGELLAWSGSLAGPSDVGSSGSPLAARWTSRFSRDTS